MKELLKTVLRFAIWAMLFVVTMFAGMIVLSIILFLVLRWASLSKGIQNARIRR